MKEIVGYLIDRTTGLGISGKTVSYKRLDGSAPVVGTTDATGTSGSYYQSLGSPTDAAGRFAAKFELSPGPINIEVDVGASEKKVRKWDEKAQLGWQWSSDINRIGKALGNGFIRGFLNEMALSIVSGHQYRIGTGGAIIDGALFSVENGPIDITGNANPSGPANPRLDLITLRQYKETAAGQDAGRQRVVVTEGTVSSVVPATPTGADFVDLPLGVVSTAQGAGVKTIYPYVKKSIFDKTPHVYTAEGTKDYGAGATSVPLNTNTGIPPSSGSVYSKAFTIPDLSPTTVYDGYAEVNAPFTASATGGTTVVGRALLDSTANPFPDYHLQFVLTPSNGDSENVSIRIPIVGLTGASSHVVTLYAWQDLSSTFSGAIQIRHEDINFLSFLVPRS